MKKIWFDEAWSDYMYWQTQDKKTLKRINALIKDIERNHFQGIGKPEPLKGELSGFWSRRIDDYETLSVSIVSTTSATFIEDFLCETRITVLFAHSSFNDFKIIPSFKLSRLLVGSSNKIIGASCKNALAIPILCFSPPDRQAPSSPTWLWYPFGRDIINSWMDAFLQAS